MATDTAFRFENIKPEIGAQIMADKNTRLSGEYVAEIRDLLEQKGVLLFLLDSGRMMHRAKLQGEEAIF